MVSNTYVRLGGVCLVIGEPGGARRSVTSSPCFDDVVHSSIMVEVRRDRTSSLGVAAKLDS